VVAVGLAYMALAKPYAHGDQPWSDAIKNLSLRRPEERRTAAPSAFVAEKQD